MDNHLDSESGHTLVQSIRDLRADSPNFLPFIVLIYLSLNLLKDIYSFFKPGDKDVSINNEDLVPYWLALDSKDKKTLLVQEEHFSHFYGTTTYNERQIQKLERASTAIKAKQIKGVPTYRVLDNRLYE